MTTDLLIDGAQGEGGGQIVRSSLALALVTGQPVPIENIRAGREKPGLMRQHLTAVQAAAAVCGGAVMGRRSARSRSTFEPQPVRAGQVSLQRRHRRQHDARAANGAAGAADRRRARRS